MLERDDIHAWKRRCIPFLMRLNQPIADHAPGAPGDLGLEFIGRTRQKPLAKKGLVGGCHEILCGVEQRAVEVKEHPLNAKWRCGALCTHERGFSKTIR